jgi:hypothetical protein
MTDKPLGARTGRGPPRILVIRIIPISRPRPAGAMFWAVHGGRNGKL